MKLSDLRPKTPATLADYSDMRSLQERFAKAEADLADLSARVGLAKHILEYDGIRTKQALARGMSAPLAGGASAVKAEAEARSSSIYDKEIGVLAAEHALACSVIAENDAAKCRWETCRSMLSMLRDAARIT